MNDPINPELELAYEYVHGTGASIFLTRKAGSGKTTFLHYIKAEGRKRLVVLAPTGVAAINAGGMTIHSFFQLPFGMHLPDVRRQEDNGPAVCCPVSRCVNRWQVCRQPLAPC